MPAPAIPVNLVSTTRFAAVRARLWEAVRGPLLANAGSLVGTTAVSAGLGFLYWLLVARAYPLDVMGFAAAAISAMTLLGTIAVLGLGTLLIGELPRRPYQQAPLIGTAVTAAATAGAVAGVAFAVLAPHLSPDLALLADDPASTLLFATGVALTSTALVVDQTCIALLRGHLQLIRNTPAAVGKLAALWLLVTTVPIADGRAVYATWVAGTLVSLLIAARPAVARGLPHLLSRSAWSLLRGLGRTTLGHHVLNVGLQASDLALPVVVAAVLSTFDAALFFTAWRIAMFVFVGPVALTTALYAVGSHDPAALAQRIRLTLALAALTGLAANAALVVAAEPVLRLFGATYAGQGAQPLHVLALGVFPLIVKDHYVAICRVRGLIGPTAVRVVAAGLLELGLASLGAYLAGLDGLSLGWVAALALQAILMARTVYRAAAPRAPSSTGRPDRVPATPPRPAMQYSPRIPQASIRTDLHDR